MSGTVKIRLWIIRETEKALFVSKLPADRDYEGVWIPRSQCIHLTKQPPQQNGWRDSVIEMEEWIAEAKNLI